MKRTILFLLAAALLMGCTAGPAGAASQEKPPEKPPSLTVRAGDGEITATLSTYSWDWPNTDGTRTGVEADGMHPLDMLAYMTPLPLNGARSVELRFEPGAVLDHLTVRRWDIRWAGDRSKYESDFETLPFALDGDRVTVDLPDGQGGIFEVHAYFTGESHGDGWYAFCLESPPDLPAEAIPFEGQPVRISWREGLSELPAAQIIRSRAELAAAVQGEAGYESAADLLDEQVAACGEGYFAQSELILLRIESGSGSIRYEVRAVERTPTGVTVAVHREAPEVCTADMAAWLIFVRVPQGIVGETPVTMTVE